MTGLKIIGPGNNLSTVLQRTYTWYQGKSSTCYANGSAQNRLSTPREYEQFTSTIASHYKEKYCASYPPFSFFAKFVCDQAKTLNNPSFAPLTGGSNVGKAEHSFKYNVKTPVSVKRTDVSVNSDDSHNCPAEKMTADPDKQCPLHNKPETSAATRDQGREQEEGAPQTVTSKCTDICGTTIRSRSCSRIIQQVRERGQSNSTPHSNWMRHAPGRHVGNPHAWDRQPLQTP